MNDYDDARFVVIEQQPHGPAPYPLEHGYRSGAGYRVLGVYRPAGSDECWLLLANDHHQLRYISRRHVRTSAIGLTARDVRMEGDKARQPTWLAPDKSASSSGAGYRFRM